MNVNKRDGRAADAERRAGQRTPRSGGRTVAQRTARTPGFTAERGRPGDRLGVGRAGRLRGEHDFPVQGTAALRPRERVTDPTRKAEATRKDGPRRIDDPRSLRVWDSSGESGLPDKATRATGSARLKVAPPLPVAVPQAPFVGLILVLVVSGVLGILVVNTKINENSFRLGKLQDQQATLDIQEQQLKKQIADAEAPGNLAAQARKLGLVESGPPAFIRLPDGRVIGVPQPAGGEPAITSQQDTSAGQQSAGG